MNMPTPEAIVGLPTIMPLLEAPTTTPSEVAKPEKRKIQHTEVKPAKRKRTMMPNLEQDLSLQKHLYNAVYEPTQVIDKPPAVPVPPPGSPVLKPLNKD